MTQTTVIGFIVAVVATAMALPFWRRWCGSLHLMDNPGQRKLQRHPVPLAGGPAVLTGMLATLGLILLLAPDMRFAFARHARIWLAVIGGTVVMTLLGVLDDRHELRPRIKFALQLAIALGVAAAGLRVTLFVPNLVFQYAITVLWILTVINAFNFMDNMNGLCAGLGVIAAGTFAAASARHGQYPEVLFSLMVCGALLGFLPFNYPRARAFLGDAGSHLTGFCMAVLALLPQFYTAQDPRRLAVLSPLLILAVPLLDLVWVVLLRLKLGKPFYVGDTNHLSHRLVRRGLSRPTAVAVIWLLAAMGSVLALL